MLVKQELINKIKDYFGLNVYETKVWLALLSKGVASAGEVAEMSGVPRSRTYDVLEGLEKRGFAIEKLGKPVKYLGVKPDRILEKLKNNVRKDAEEKIQDLGKVIKTTEFGQLQELYDQGINPVKREDISAALKGKSNISNYLRDVLQEAKKEVIICTNVEEFESKIKLFEQTVEQLKKSNIKTRIALSGDKELIKKVASKLNVKISVCQVDAKFFIVDRTEILFYLNKDNKNDDTAIWLNSSFFAEAFAVMFDRAVL